MSERLSSTGNLFPITEPTARELKTAFRNGRWIALNELAKLCESDLEEVYFYRSLKYYIGCYYSMIGIEDVHTIEDLHKVLIEGSLSDWVRSFSQASDTAYNVGKKKEVGRVVPFGVRISQRVPLDPIELLVSILCSGEFEAACLQKADLGCGIEVSSQPSIAAPS